MIFVVYTDGACRGNPGPMAIGASIQDDRGTELAVVSALIGQGTNNVAEHRAGIEGLKKARDLGATEVELRMDSELVVEQINGRYKVKNAALKLLHAESSNSSRHSPRPLCACLPERESTGRRAGESGV